MYREANSFISKSEEKAKKIEVIEQKLQIDNEETRQACLRQGKELAVRRKLLGLQASMEMYYLRN